MSTSEQYEPPIHELVAYVMQHGASAAARHFAIGYSIVRRRVRAADVKLHRGRRRDKTLAARNAEVRLLRMQGMYLIDIGKRFKLGRERIRQILAATGGDPLLPSGVREDGEEPQSANTQPSHPPAVVEVQIPAPLSQTGTEA